jgi:N6-adenosine-specific RNA methylase IME4/ParB-like chromosome segregation protein Spo0J
MKAHPAAALFPELHGKELEDLADDIKRHGLRHPIVTYKGAILDGRNRYAACSLACVKPTFAEWDGQGGSPTAFVVSVNIQRRHLDASQRAIIGAQLIEALKAEAAERQKAGLKQGSAPVRANLPAREATAADAGRAREKAAAIANVGARTMESAVTVLAKSAPSVVEAVKEGRVAVSDAAQISKLPHAEQVRALARVTRGDAKTLTKAVVAGDKQAQATHLRNKPMPLPTGPFGVITADPPWLYTLREEDESHRGKTDYSQMTLDQVAALSIEKLAAKDCALWLWCTNAFLANGDAAKVVSAWGFEGKTILTWDKQRIGIGNYLRNSTEHCIIATRGSPVFQPGGVPTLISAPRREHSRKPDEFYDLVEKVCPDNARVELFGRTPRAGWVIWGAQAEKFAQAGSRP